MAAETAQADKGKGIRREDPPPRPVEQTANRGFLADGQADQHYVWVSEVNDPTINVSFYQALGYKIAQFDPSEARPSLGWNEYKQGDPIKSMGMVLMQCSKERKAEIDRVGHDGNHGWSAADRIQETIRNREIDPLSEEEKRGFRGITSVRHGNDDRRKWEF